MSKLANRIAARILLDNPEVLDNRTASGWWVDLAEREKAKEPPPEYMTAVVGFGPGGKVRVSCEIADSDELQIVGLQKHAGLQPYTGMAFPYDPPRKVSFHMADVSFPIDIAFVGSDSKVTKIVENAEPGTKEVWTMPHVALVVELPGGFCASKGIEVGTGVFQVDIDTREAQVDPLVKWPQIGPPAVSDSGKVIQDDLETGSGQPALVEDQSSNNTNLTEQAKGLLEYYARISSPNDIVDELYGRMDEESGYDLEYTFGPWMQYVIRLSYQGSDEQMGTAYYASGEMYQDGRAISSVDEVIYSNEDYGRSTWDFAEAVYADMMDQVSKHLHEIDPEKQPTQEEFGDVPVVSKTADTVTSRRLISEVGQKLFQMLHNAEAPAGMPTLGSFDDMSGITNALLGTAEKLSVVLSDSSLSTTNSLIYSKLQKAESEGDVKTYANGVHSLVSLAADAAREIESDPQFASAIMAALFPLASALGVNVSAQQGSTFQHAAPGVTKNKQVSASIYHTIHAQETFNPEITRRDINPLMQPANPTHDRFKDRDSPDVVTDDQPMDTHREETEGYDPTRDMSDEAIPTRPGR